MPREVNNPISDEMSGAAESMPDASGLGCEIYAEVIDSASAVVPPRPAVEPITGYGAKCLIVSPGVLDTGGELKTGALIRMQSGEGFIISAVALRNIAGRAEQLCKSGEYAIVDVLPRDPELIGRPVLYLADDEYAERMARGVEGTLTK